MFNENSTSMFPSPAWDVRKLTKLKYTALTLTGKTKQNYKKKQQQQKPNNPSGSRDS